MVSEPAKHAALETAGRWAGHETRLTRWKGRQAFEVEALGGAGHDLGLASAAKAIEALTEETPVKALLSRSSWSGGS